MKLKVPYNIRKSLARVLPFAMLMGAPAMNSCKPEPMREIVVDYDWDNSVGLVPPKDLIKSYADDPKTEHVYINIIQRDTHGSTWEPRHYKRARDSLQTCINIKPDKIRGTGVVKVGVDGAHINPDTLTKKYGMWESDSVWFTLNGWSVISFFDEKSR